MNNKKFRVKFLGKFFTKKYFFLPLFKAILKLACKEAEGLGSTNSYTHILYLLTISLNTCEFSTGAEISFTITSSKSKDLSINKSSLFDSSGTSFSSEAAAF